MVDWGVLFGRKLLRLSWYLVWRIAGVEKSRDLAQAKPEHFSLFGKSWKCSHQLRIPIGFESVPTEADRLIAGLERSRRLPIPD